MICVGSLLTACSNRIPVWAKNASGVLLLYKVRPKDHPCDDCTFVFRHECQAGGVVPSLQRVQQALFSGTHMASQTKENIGQADNETTKYATRCKSLHANNSTDHFQRNCQDVLATQKIASYLDCGCRAA